MSALTPSRDISAASSVGNVRTVTDDGVRGELPEFQQMADPSSFRWEKLRGDVFCAKIEAAYEEAVHWRRNIFSVPSGKAGKMFVAELTRLYDAYATSSAMECVALRAASVLCMLLLQKPHQKSKARDHTVLSDG